MMESLLTILSLSSFVFLVWAIIERNSRLYWQDEYYKLQASLQNFNTKDNGLGILALAAGAILLLIVLLLLIIVYGQ